MVARTRQNKQDMRASIRETSGDEPARTRLDVALIVWARDISQDNGLCKSSGSWDQLCGTRLGLYSGKLRAVAPLNQAGAGNSCSSQESKLDRGPFDRAQSVFWLNRANREIR
jgi:hypothetical protein